MRVEIRRRPSKDGEGPGPKARGLVLVSESKEESKLLDEIFGDRPVDPDGLVGAPLVAECRLSDGYAEHYIYIGKPV